MTLNEEAQTLQQLVARFRASATATTRHPCAPRPSRWRRRRRHRAVRRRSELGHGSRLAPRRAVAQSHGSAAVAQDNWEEFWSRSDELETDMLPS